MIKNFAAKSDPRDFLSLFNDKKGVITDEVQEVPELLSYMQEKIAKHKQALLFGTVYTLGTAALFAALYKYLENRPVPVYHLK